MLYDQARGEVVAMNVLKNKLIAQKRRLLWLLLSSVMTGASVVGQAYFFVSTVDAVFLKKASFSDILPLLAGLLLVQLARTAFDYMSGRIGVSMAAKAKKDFRKSLLEKFSRTPMEASLKAQSGKKVSVMLDA